MKTLHKILATLLLGAACSGCDLTLIPEDKVTPQTYFQSEVDLRLWTNQFYTLLDSPDSASGLNADDMVDKSMGDVISGTRMASDESGWTWTSLRKINYYLQNSHNCTDEAARTKYDGVAYFFRAYFYYVKVRRYGDVPWYDTVIGSEEEELLKKPREDRGIIMDHVMSDLDDAIDMLPRDKDVARVTRWAALAFKSRAALYEGTWRKYRGLPDADKYLQQAADAAATFIAESGYSLYKEGTEPYRDLFCSDDAKQSEVILARLYNFEGLNLAHSVQFNIRNAATGFTRRFMNHYLMADGSRFTEKEGHETMFYTEETAGRDPRMAQTVLCPGYVAKGEERSHAERHDRDDGLRADQIRLDGGPQRRLERHVRLAVVPHGRGVSQLCRSQGRAGHADAGRPDRFDRQDPRTRRHGRTRHGGRQRRSRSVPPGLLPQCHEERQHGRNPRNPPRTHRGDWSWKASACGTCSAGKRVHRWSTKRHPTTASISPARAFTTWTATAKTIWNSTPHSRPAPRPTDSTVLRIGSDIILSDMPPTTAATSWRGVRLEIHLERGTRLPVAHSGRPARTDGRTADPESRMDRQHQFRLMLTATR